MCLSAEEITRKQLARGRQLLLPTACSTLGGQPQDAVGEKWLGGPAAALRQNHRTGQGQVGSGLCCCCGLRGCLDLKLIYGFSYSAIIRQAKVGVLWVLSKVVFWTRFRHFVDLLWFKTISLRIFYIIALSYILDRVWEETFSWGYIRKLLHSLRAKRLAMAFSHED